MEEQVKNVETIENDEGVFEAVEDTEEMPMEKATKLFTAYDQINSINKLRDEMKKQQRSILGDEELVNHLSKAVSSMEPDAVKALSDEAIEEIFTIDGGEIEIAMDFNGDKKKEIEFKRDYLVYIRESDIANETLDRELELLEKEINEDQEAIKELLSDFGDLSTFMRAKLQQEFEEAEGSRKEKLSKTIAAYDDSYTLERVIKTYKDLNPRNTISDYYNRADQLFERYMKNIKKIGFNTDITIYGGLEKKFLDEKYHKYPNLFIFSIIKMYAHKKDINKTEDGVFLSQLLVNLKYLYGDLFADEGKKETFKNSICKVLDLFLEE